MTLTEFATLLAGTGYSVAYDHFETEPSLPYICYKRLASNNAQADGNSQYVPITQLQVELYSKRVNLSAEQTLETALSGLAWTKEYDFDTDERVHITYYTVTII